MLLLISGFLRKFSELVELSFVYKSINKKARKRRTSSFLRLLSLEKLGINTLG